MRRLRASSSSAHASHSTSRGRSGFYAWTVGESAASATGYPHRVLVVGLGGMGSSAAAELARRGRSVLGFDRYAPVHDRGSSHGKIRLIRQAYFEDPAYVPMLFRAYERWRDLESLTGRDLLRETGGLMIGPPASRTVVGSRTSAEQWGIAHELLSPGDVARRWPTFTLARDDVALYERHAGFVAPEATVDAQLELARGSGAELHFEEPVLGWTVEAAGVEVTTAGGRYRGSHLVVAAGAWAPRLLEELGLPLAVERHVQFWLEPKDRIERYLPTRHPVFVWEDSLGTQAYGFPATDGQARSVKVALFRDGTPADPGTLQRRVAPVEAERLLAFLASRIPGLGPKVHDAVPCMYTTSPDMHFVLGFAPGEPRVVVCSPCSGHGFKFVPVIGEIVADLVENGASRFDLSLFDPSRFAP